MLTYIKLGIGALAGAALAAAVVTLIATYSWIPSAKEETRQQERAAALQQAMDLIQQRSKTNAEIRNLDDGALCAELGGVLVNGACQ